MHSASWLNTSIDWYGSEYSAVMNKVSSGVTGSSSTYTRGRAGSVPSTVTASGACRDHSIPIPAATSANMSQK
ncbi:hypothetical protein GCM10010195_47860 [Kitasatospora griseola]|nr:hypothetical protein GCM10010195_47860 [Kitasatospora griseola]